MKTNKTGLRKYFLISTLCILVAGTMVTACSKRDNGTGNGAGLEINDDPIGTLTSYVADVNILADMEAGPSGADVNWDFSKYQASSTTTLTNEKCPGNSNCSTMPNANRIGFLSGSNPSYHYLQRTDNELFNLGQKTASGEVITFIDTRLEMKFPVKYGLEYDDTWKFNSQTLNEEGKFTAAVDAYGTLKTPLGTFPNTLRIKRVEERKMTVPGIPTYTVVSETYTWLSPDYKGALLYISFNTITSSGGDPSYSRSLSYGNNK